MSRRWWAVAVLSLALASPVARAQEEGAPVSRPTAHQGEVPAMFGYFIRDFFGEPWRVKGSWERIALEARVILALNGVLLWTRWRRRPR